MTDPERDDKSKDNNSKITIRKRNLVLSLVVVVSLSVILLASGPISSYFMSISRINLRTAAAQSSSSPTSSAPRSASSSGTTSTTQSPRSSSPAAPSSQSSTSPSSTNSNPSSPSTNTSPKSTAQSPNTSGGSNAASTPSPTPPPNQQQVDSRAISIALQTLRSAHEIIDSAATTTAVVAACGVAIAEAIHHGGGDVDECTRAGREFFEAHPQLIDAINQSICRLIPFGKLCGGHCVDTSKNPNCGDCNIDCSDTSQHPTGQVCSFQGNTQQYACACSEGQKSCGTGVCQDLQKSDTNCGACGNVCGAGSTSCSGGACQCPFGQQYDTTQKKCVCPSGQMNCNGICTDIQEDRSNCGACNRTCATNQICESGQCIACPNAGDTVCGGFCVDTQTDETHCGGCPGTTCAANQICSGGTCSGCSPGLTKCGDVCSNLQTDSQNCGACGNVCNSDQTCSGGTCSGCSPGLTKCGDVCSNLQIDDQNCGACGHACPSGQTCSSGACVCGPDQEPFNGGCFPKCPPEAPRDANGNCKCTNPNLELCDGQCMDPATFTTFNHCGGCDNDCSRGTTGGVPDKYCNQDPAGGPYFCDVCPIGQHLAGCFGLIQCAPENCFGEEDPNNPGTCHIVCR